VIVAALLACDVPLPPTDSGGDTGEAQLLREIRESGKSNAQGLYTVFVDVEAGDTAFQVTASAAGGNLTSVQQVRDPSGKKVLDWERDLGGPNNVTGALIPQRSTTAVNWPIQEKDGPLAEGRWEVTWLVMDESRFPEARANVEAVTSIKRDPDPSAAEIRVRILWARGVDDPRVERAVRDAVEEWREIWAVEGITLVERYDTTTLDPDLGFYDEGSKDAEEASAGKEVGELQLVVGETIDGDGYLYGVSSGIPGTIQISESTYVVLSWLSHAGRDGQFDRDEINLMGQTMAHEVGHYIGLFHPVEGGYFLWDSLKDTPECASFSSCEVELGRNLMFPFSLCYPQTGCINQNQITDDQSGVIHLQVSAL
jgi:hypothetical protein